MGDGKVSGVSTARCGLLAERGSEPCIRCIRGACCVMLCLGERVERAERVETVEREERER